MREKELSIVNTVIEGTCYIDDAYSEVIVYFTYIHTRRHYCEWSREHHEVSGERCLFITKFDDRRDLLMTFFKNTCFEDNKFYWTKSLEALVFYFLGGLTTWKHKKRYNLGTWFWWRRVLGCGKIISFQKSWELLQGDPFISFLILILLMSMFCKSYSFYYWQFGFIE